MDAKYNPTNIEAKWYQYWLDQKLFHSKPDGRDAYTVVIPPPNVTGVLHMGHVLNNTIQDILVRRARLEGKNACWAPGTDHASIATEAKVIKRLKEQGINKSDLTREEFLKHAWAWTEEHGGIILKQLRTLGCSCDWDRTAFTMDETRSKAVIDVFCDLYNKGLIYRGLRMVNWDPERQTALSDEEVIYQEEHSKLYYLKYYVLEGDEAKGESAPQKSADFSGTPQAKGDEAGEQLDQLNLLPLHQAGYKGKGIRIGIADGGFYRANSMLSLPQDQCLGYADLTDDEEDKLREYIALYEDECAMDIVIVILDEDIEEELSLEEIDHLKDEDFEEHLDFLEDEAELDEELMKKLMGE
mgnify:CR=1 FL=1